MICGDLRKIYKREESSFAFLSFCNIILGSRGYLVQCCHCLPNLLSDLLQNVNDNGIAKLLICLVGIAADLIAVGETHQPGTFPGMQPSGFTIDPVTAGFGEHTTAVS